MIKVLLVNGQRLFNEAVESLLIAEDDMIVVGKATTGNEAMEQIKIKQPDVILLDVHMSDVDGIKMTVHIKDNYPNIKVIFLTTFSDKQLVIAGIVAGADGFLLKNIDTENLIQSIRNAYRDQVVISGDAAKILAKAVIELQYDRHEILKTNLEKRNIYFSDREIEVALLMVDQLTNKRIAQRLYLSEGTVKNYISGIYSKLKIDTRKEAIEYLEKEATI